MQFEILTVLVFISTNFILAQANIKKMELEKEDILANLHNIYLENN